jgi:hypothetical protein
MNNNIPLMIDDKVSIKKNLEEKLYDMLTKGLHKYIKRIYKKKKEEYENDILVCKNFQKKLYKIAKWSDKTINTEFLHFISWCKRHYNIDKEEMESMLKKTILLSTQIMINRSRIFTENFLSTYEFPKIRDIYYKCLKKIARIFYENPKSIYENDISFGTLKENIKSPFYNIIPIKKITDYLENKEESIIMEKEIVEYNFNKNDSSSNSVRDHFYKEKVNKNDDFNLKYVCSDDFKNRIEIDKKSSHSIIPNQNTNNEDEDNIKHIRIPKLNKLYLKKKIDNIEDNFFD